MAYTWLSWIYCHVCLTSYMPRPSRFPWCIHTDNFGWSVQIITFLQFLQWKPQQDATVYHNFIIPYFKWSSTYFGRHTAHHQEPKTAQAASGFAYVEGYRYLTFSWQGYLTTARPITFHIYKTRVCLCNFRLLMMGGVSPETCWASFKIRNNKILLHCCIFLGIFTVIIVLWRTGPRTSSLWRSSLCSFRCRLNTSPLLCPNMHLSTLLWKTIFVVLLPVLFVMCSQVPSPVLTDRSKV